MFIFLFSFLKILFKDFTPELVLTHPDYNKPSRFQNDIAVVKLDADVVEHGKVI